MSRNIDKIKANIAALMAKSKDIAATEAEASSAMKMAQKLMDKFGVSEEDIKERPDEIDFVERYADHTRKSLHPVDTLLGNAIARYTCTKVWSTDARRSDNTRTAVFFGVDSDVELALYLRHSLMTAMDYGWDIYKRYERDPADSLRVARRSFMYGFATVLRERMEAYTVHIPSKGKQLVVLKDQLVTQALKDRGVNLGSASRKRRPNGVNGSAYQSGKVTGNGAELGRGVSPTVAGLLA